MHLRLQNCLSVVLTCQVGDRVTWLSGKWMCRSRGISNLCVLSWPCTVFAGIAILKQLTGLHAYSASSTHVTQQAFLMDKQMPGTVPRQAMLDGDAPKASTLLLQPASPGRDDTVQSITERKQKSLHRTTACNSAIVFLQKLHHWATYRVLSGWLDR
ncbi:hypothetical protein ABBQ38_009733 [Trebouxia sp. C0009 RCD-2024]